LRKDGSIAIPDSTQISSRSSASGKARFDRSLASLNLVSEEQVGAEHAEIGGADRDGDLDQGRLIELDDDEDVEQRQHQHHHRHDHAEEQVGDVRRLPAVARLQQHGMRFLLADPFAEIEVVEGHRDIFGTSDPLFLGPSPKCLRRG
jgi:hypothetical protein